MNVASASEDTLTSQRGLCDRIKFLHFKVQKAKV